MLLVLGLILAAPSKTIPEPHPALIESRATLIVRPCYDVKIHESWKNVIANSTTPYQVKALHYLLRGNCERGNNPLSIWC